MNTMVEVNTINYREKYIELKDRINNKIKEIENEIKEMKIYFEETNNSNIRNREDKIKYLETTKVEGIEIIKLKQEICTEQYTYELAYIHMIERHLIL